MGIIMKEKFGFFGPATLLYAVMYVFCTFKNPSGITYSVFIVASLVYLCFALIKLGHPLNKGSLFYMISMMLLGVSTFCTDDRRIIMLNKTGIFILMIVLLLQQFCNTSEWQLGKHLDSMFRLMFASLGEIGKPFSDGLAYCKEKNKILSRKVAAVLIGLVAALPLLIVVLVLLGSADAIFGDMVDSMVEGIRAGDTLGDLVSIIFRIIAFFVLVYAWLSYLSADNIPKEERDTRKGEPIIAITVTSILSTVYILFCGIQVVYLFFGNMNLPEGYTYAGYAREGFFQLLAVSVLNLLIVLVGLSCFRESKALKAILTIMSLCTFVMIISSALRMIMYIRYYFLTFQRVFVLWALVVLFVLFIGVILSIYKGKFQLFRYSLTTVTVLYLVFSFSHPDYFIAKVNIANAVRAGMEEWEPREGDFFQSGRPYEDHDYIMGMSADAAPVLIPYMAEQGVIIQDFYEENIFEGLTAEGSASNVHDNYYYLRYLDKMKAETENFSWRTYNVSRHVMLKLVETHRN